MYVQVSQHTENEDHEETASGNVALYILDHVPVLERFAGGKRGSASALLATCFHGDNEPNSVLGTRIRYHLAIKVPLTITLNILRLRGNICRLTPVGPCRATP